MPNDETENDSTAAPNEHSTPPTSPSVGKKTIQQRFLSWLPTPAQFRKDLKASIALIIAMVMTLDLHCRSVIGQTVLLVPIVVIFYFPVRTYGVQTEAVIYGTFGALISGLYSLLGTYLANLARDHNNANPIQPGPSAILAVFLFFGTFVLNYIRMKFHKANFATVNACILLSFTMTEGAAIPIFTTELSWLFLRPIAVAGAIALAVNYFLWPDDSVANYMQVLQSTLTNCETFFKENSEAFLNMQTDTGASSLSSLQQRLHGGILLLIDCKRAAQREILYSKLNASDFGDLTRTVKDMYPSLHGLGLSVIMEKDFLSNLAQDPLLKEAATGEPESYSSGFQDSVALMKTTSEQLVQTTVACLDQCKSSLSSFQPRTRSTMDIFMWPFPRIISFGKSRHSQHLADMEQASEQLNNTVYQLEKALDAFDQTQHSNGMERYSQICYQKKQHRQENTRNDSNNQYSYNESLSATTYGPLYLVFLYQHNIREFCALVKSLASRIQQLHQKRTSRKIHFPQTTLKKWFHRTNEVDPTFFNNKGNTQNSKYSHGNGNVDGQLQMDDTGRGMTDTTNLSLVQTMTRTDVSPAEQDMQDGFVRSRNNAAIRSDAAGTGAYSQNSQRTSRLYMDPDVSPPSTTMERFFNKIYNCLLWFKDIDTMFALKTAVGMVLLAIPAWMPQSAGWFADWRGQWSLITLCLWIFPTPGMFFFGLYSRVLGSVVGAVLGIVVWEITRGNPYGLGVVCFILFIPLYHVFFFSAVYRVAGLMGKITMILVIVYAYNSDLQGGNYVEPVYTVAGKRLLAVVVGIVAAGILLLFPAPVQGRVELRKRLAKTIRDIGRLYGIVTAELTSNKMAAEPTLQQQKAFRRIALDIRRQIADERNLLAHAKYEPPLRGKFQAKRYSQILEIVDSLGALVTSMGHAIRTVNGVWRKQIGTTLLNERREYLASIMTTLKLLSTTLAAKTPLPPYMVEPAEARARFAKILEHQINVRPTDMEDPSFPSYSTYMMNGSAFVTELQELLEAVTDLVGVEDPEEWLLLHV